MGWDGAVDHGVMLDALPPATGLRLQIDTGAFVDRGEPSRDNLRDVLEPLVHAAGPHPIASLQLLRVVRSLLAAAEGPSSAAAEPLRVRLANLVAQLEERT